MTGILLAVVLGLVVGLVVGGLGGGGGVLTVPALVYVLGLDAHDATTASVVIVGICALVGVLARLRVGVDLRRGLVLGLVGLPAAWLGTVLNRHADQAVLLLAFAVLVVAVAVAMLVDVRAHTHRPAEPVAPGPSGGGTALAAPPRHLAAAMRLVGCGLAVGFLTGFLGVGGGFLAVPALVLVLRMPMSLAVGTSLLVIVMNSVTALVARAGDIALDWHVVGPFTIAAVVATLVGKRIADRLSGATLTVAFAVLLLAVGLFVGVESLPAL
jgi:uncharacterized membrane protein YfcA